MKLIKKAIVFLLISFVGIQFIPTKLNISSHSYPNDFSDVLTVPVYVKNMLEKSCYDCHSNKTKYPWYNRIQPLAFLLGEHIDEGKSDLNFNDFGTYSNRKKRNKIKAIIKQIEKNEMPPNYYTMFHSDAKLSEKSIKDLVDWLEKINI